MSDVKCPYCEEMQDIDSEQSREEEVLNEIECYDCEKNFTFMTQITFDYTSYKADCLNGGEHKYKRVHTCPIKYTLMSCEDCEKTREPTLEEWKVINQ